MLAVRSDRRVYGSSDGSKIRLPGRSSGKQQVRDNKRRICKLSQT